MLANSEVAGRRLHPAEDLGHVGGQTKPAFAWRLQLRRWNRLCGWVEWNMDS